MPINMFEYYGDSGDFSGDSGDSDVILANRMTQFLTNSIYYHTTPGPIYLSIRLSTLIKFVLLAVSKKKKLN